MKKIVLSLLGAALISLPSFSQGFEGQVTYDVEVKGDNAALFSAMMPKSMDLFFLGKDAMLRMNGGMTADMVGDIVTKGSEGITYMVVHKKKTVYKIDPAKEKKDKADKPTVTEEGTETVKGYNCKKYLVKFAKNDDQEVYQYMWCTNDIKIGKPKMASSGSNLFLDEIDGFPVKIDQYITIKQMGGMTINQEMTLDKISETKPDATLFEIPKKYTMEDFDKSKFGK